MKIIRSFIPACICSILFFSCNDLSNLAKPETISVKATNAAYNLSLGKNEILVRDHLNTATLKESITSSTSADTEDTDGSADTNEAASTPAPKFSVYDYWPGGESSGKSVQQFLFNYPIATIPLDFGNYLNDLDILSDISDDLSQDFTIPELEAVDFKKTIVMPDFNVLIREKFTLTGLEALRIAEGLAIANLNLPSPLVTINAPDFETMTFAEGSLVLTFERTDPINTMSTAFQCSIQAILVDANGNEITRSKEKADLKLEEKKSTTLVLPLAGKTLVPSLQIKFDGTCSGGQAGKIHTYRISARLADDSQVSKITGLNMQNDELGDDGVASLENSIPLEGLGSYLIQAVVKEGALTLVGSLPDGWSGVICTPNITVSGGLELENSEFKDVSSKDTSKSYLINRSANLWNKRLHLDKEVALGGTLSISLENATLAFEAGKTYEEDVIGNVTVTKLGEATIDISQLIDEESLSPKVAKPLDTVGSYVKSVIFTQIGMDGTIFCDLPAKELNITPTVTSKLFEVTESAPLTQTVTLTAANTTGKLLMTKDYENEFELTPTKDSEADFDVNFSVSGSDSEHTSYIDVTELELGHTYSFKTDLAFISEWTKIVLNLSAENDELNFSGDIPTGLNIQNMLDSFLKDEQKNLLDNVEIGNSEGEVEAFLTITRPSFTATKTIHDDPLENFPNFAGFLKAQLYAADNAEKPTATKTLYDDTNFGDDYEGIPLRNVKDVKSPASVADKDLLITKNLFDSKEKYSVEIKGDADKGFASFGDLLNYRTPSGERAAGLDISYDIGIREGSKSDELTLTKEQFETLSQDGATPGITAAINIIIPLTFSITNDGIHIDDFMQLAGVEREESKDLLSRESKDDDVTERYQKYGKIIKEVVVAYTVNNNMGQRKGGTRNPITMTTTLQLQPTDIVKTLDADGISHELKLSHDEMLTVIGSDSYPFQPKISAVIEPGEITIPRTGFFSIEGAIKLVLDGEVTVWGDDE